MLMVTITDLETDGVHDLLVEDGSYLLVVTDPCKVEQSVRLPDGRHVITIDGADDEPETGTHRSPSFARDDFDGTPIRVVARRGG